MQGVYKAIIRLYSGYICKQAFYLLGDIITQIERKRNMSNWKREELKISKAMDSQRALMKGTDTKEDVIHSLFCIDSKLRKTWQVERWYDDLKKYADKAKKIPVLVLRKPSRKRRLAVIDFDYFVSLCKGAGINPDSEQGGGVDNGKV
jgi:hypothetical protein